jgi:hypothetical protein
MFYNSHHYYTLMNQIVALRRNRNYKDVLLLVFQYRLLIVFYISVITTFQHNTAEYNQKSDG